MLPLLAGADAENGRIGGKRTMRLTELAKMRQWRT